MTLRQTATAVGAGLVPVSFAAQGGTPPYTYSVLPGGAGGQIGVNSGSYTSPAILPLDPKLSIDTIQAEDSLGATVTAQISVLHPILLFCDILKNELNLDDQHIYLFDQKIFQPTDSNLYIAVSVLNQRPFGNTFVPDSSGPGIVGIQSINVQCQLDVNVISRSNQALFRKEEVLMAIMSYYSQSQQTLNSFYIGRLPMGAQFVNLSEIDGSAIPYRFNISVSMQYFARKVQDVPYFDEFAEVEVVTEP